MRALLAVLLLLTSYCKTIKAQEKMNTDRPDQSDGANVMDKGHFQVETEFYYNRFTTGNPALISSSLLRYGLFKNIEARLLVEQGQERDRFISETTQGLYPFAISAKLSLLKDRKVLPDISVIGYLHIPVTNGASKQSYWSPMITAVLEKELGKLTGTTNLSIKQEAFENKWAFQFSAEMKYEVSDKVSVFGEYFAQYARHEDPLHNLDGGILFHFASHWMVSMAFGHSIFAEENDNYFINTGVAFSIH